MIQVLRDELGWTLTPPEMERRALGLDRLVAALTSDIARSRSPKVTADYRARFADWSARWATFRGAMQPTRADADLFALHVAAYADFYSDLNRNRDPDQKLLATAPPAWMRERVDGTSSSASSERTRLQLTERGRIVVPILLLGAGIGVVVLLGSRRRGR